MNVLGDRDGKTPRFVRRSFGQSRFGALTSPVGSLFQAILAGPLARIVRVLVLWVIRVMLRMLLF